MIMIPPKNVKNFQEELLEKFGQHSWIIGDLRAGKERNVHFANDLQIIEVEELIKDEF
jgi:hypothetical protein